jgi:hypothetical protein
MNWLVKITACVPFVAVALGAALSAEQQPDGVVCLLEENAAELLPKLTNPTGDPGNGEIERLTVFSGDSAVKITVFQLIAHRSRARRQVEAARAATESVEARFRLETILESGDEQPGSVQRTEASLKRILEIIAKRRNDSLERD